MTVTWREASSARLRQTGAVQKIIIPRTKSVIHYVNTGDVPRSKGQSSNTNDERRLELDEADGKKK